MLYEVVKIEISRLGLIYPRISNVKEFKDVKYITTRVIRQDWYSETFITDQKYKLVDDVNYDNRTIQNILYRKYRMEIIAKEWNGIQLMKFAQMVTITTMDGTIHRAKILSLEDGVPIDKTLNYKYTVVYADINQANYNDGNQNVINFLKSDRLFVETSYSTTQMNSLKIVTNKVIDSDFPYPQSGSLETLLYDKTFHTILQPFYKISDISQLGDDIAGLQKISNTKLQEYVSLRLYLNEADKNFVKKYAPICTGEVGDCYVIVNNSATELQAIERPIIEVEETPIGIDCYQVDVLLKYKSLDYYHY